MRSLLLPLALACACNKSEPPAAKTAATPPSKEDASSSAAPGPSESCISIEVLTRNQLKVSIALLLHLDRGRLGEESDDLEGTFRSVTRDELVRMTALEIVKQREELPGRILASLKKEVKHEEGLLGIEVLGISCALLHSALAGSSDPKHADLIRHIGRRHQRCPGQEEPALSFRELKWYPRAEEVRGIGRYILGRPRSQWGIEAGKTEYALDEASLDHFHSKHTLHFDSTAEDATLVAHEIQWGHSKCPVQQLTEDFGAGTTRGRFRIWKHQETVLVIGPSSADNDRCRLVLLRRGDAALFEEFTGMKPPN